MAVLAVALLATGAVYEASASASDRRQLPPPGQLVDVGGYRLHLFCTGESSPGAPTVILEAVAAGSVPNWAWIQPEVAKASRVCSYDRAGFGWSDPNPNPFSLPEAASDLHTLLTQARIDGPYILVGHSLGGLIVRQFAADHPAEVVGIVFLDSSHPDQFVRYPEYLKQSQNLSPLIQASPLIARLGLMRLYVASGGFDFGELPARQHAELNATWSTAEHWASQRGFLNSLEAFFAQSHALGDLDNLPLVVVTAGDNDAVGWQEMQVELAALSSDSVHNIVVGANHESLAFSPQHAQASIQAILDVLAAVRSGNKISEMIARQRGP
jgi:pimeloyl-ACP methyl ester carboxylesterase